MKLNFDEIKSITQGAARIKKDEKGVRFFRFNEEEEEAYSSSSHLPKTYSTSGVQMLFRTDGALLKLKINIEAASIRTYFAVDIFVNDERVGELKNFDEKELVGLYVKNQFPLGEFEGEFELGEGEKTVRIVFPWSVVAEICEINIENATFIEPVKRAKTILMYGDSITHGYDALYPSQSYASRLAHSLDAEMFNKAIGGEVFFPELARIKNDIEPDYITVAYGTNDWCKTTKEVFVKNSRSFYEALIKNYPDAKIFAIAPIWRKEHTEYREFGEFKEVYEILEELCKDLGINYISGWDFVPKEESYFADFRLHPNDKGFEQYFKNLKKEMERFL